MTKQLENVVAHRQRHDFPSLSCSDKSNIVMLLGGCRITVENKQSPGRWLVLVEITVALVITPGAVAGLLGSGVRHGLRLPASLLACSVEAYRLLHTYAVNR